MQRKRILYLGAFCLALVVAVGARHVFEQTAAAQGRGPAYQVMPLWPQPLPYHWIFGSVTGVTVDAQDNIWVTNRGADSLGNNEKGMMLTPPTSSICCVAAPFVVQFDRAGQVVGSWGGPGDGYEWPQKPAGVAVDHNGNVWIAAAGNDPRPAGRGRGRGRGGAAPAPPPGDAHVLKFSPTGEFQLQIGQAGSTEGPGSQTTLNRPTGFAFDAAANEVYVADSGNRRVVVFDAGLGTYKRHWGAYGERPTATGPGPYTAGAPPAKQFRDVTCVEIARDGMVYVCDRSSNRIQVFQKNGTFVKEAIVSETTLGATAPNGFRSYGAVWDLAFSTDPQQQYIFVANGHDKKILILERETLAQVGSFGDGGRQPGRMLAVGSIAVDSSGNVYTGEDNEGKRVQKWVPAQGR